MLNKHLLKEKKYIELKSLPINHFTRYFIITRNGIRLQLVLSKTSLQYDSKKNKSQKINKKEVLTKFLPTFENIKAIASKVLLSTEYSH